METHRLELHNLRSQAASPKGNVRPETPTPDHSLLAAPLPTSNATSSAGNSSSQLSVPKPQNAKVPLSTRLYRWWPELAGVTSSVAFLIGIIIFLAIIDGSKMEDRHFAWEIKPPTIISILVTVCRINLGFFVAEGLGQLKWVFFEQREHQLADFGHFDEATRGPWGATWFIWKVNRRAIVATCGAVLVILILAMDPFSQQVLYYALETTKVENAVAKLPSARFNNSGALYAAFSGKDSTELSIPVVDASSTPAFSSSNGALDTFGSGSFKREASGPETIGALTEIDSSTSNPSQGKSNCSDTLMARAAYAGLFTSISPLDFSCPHGSNYGTYVGMSSWYWLIYMVAMVIFSLMFFVTAMVFTSEKSKAVWKSSSLAVLMHGSEGFDGTQLDHRSLSEMSKAAENLWAQLREDDEGNLRLAQHQ